MSSVVHYAWPDQQEGSLLLHALPHTKDSRLNGTLMVCRDEGQSWKPGLVIDPGRFAYSCLARLPDGDVGCLYETAKYQSIVFRRLSADVLTKNEGD